MRVRVRVSEREGGGYFECDSYLCFLDHRNIIGSIPNGQRTAVLPPRRCFLFLLWFGCTARHYSFIPTKIINIYGRHESRDV